MFDDKVESIILQHPNGPSKVCRKGFLKRLVARKRQLFEHPSLFHHPAKAVEPNADHPFGFLPKTCPKCLADRRRHIRRRNSPSPRSFQQLTERCKIPCKKTRWSSTLAEPGFFFSKTFQPRSHTHWSSCRAKVKFAKLLPVNRTNGTKLRHRTASTVVILLVSCTYRHFLRRRHHHWSCHRM
ncbi:hypothetical protein BKA80DRAFT_59394 [Phyllosticta citrichinensis]